MGRGRLARRRRRAARDLPRVDRGRRACRWSRRWRCFVAGLGFYMLHNTLQVNATQMAPAHRGSSLALFAAILFIGQAPE